KLKAPSSLISPAAVQGRLLVPVSAPPCRARDHLLQPPGWRSQALRLRQRRVPEIDDVDSTCRIPPQMKALHAPATKLAAQWSPGQNSKWNAYLPLIE